MKSKLTPLMIDEITKRLKVGCYAKVVAGALGIAERSYYTWLERGSKAEKLSELDKKIPDTEKIYLQLWQSVRQSESEGEVSITTMIFSQIKDDWKAGLEMLSRKYPERWARKEYMDFKGTIDGPDKREEALNEFEDMFADVPRAELSNIISETTKKLYEARNGHKGNGHKAKKNEPCSTSRRVT